MNQQKRVIGTTIHRNVEFDLFVAMCSSTLNNRMISEEILFSGFRLL